MRWIAASPWLPRCVAHERARGVAHERALTVAHERALKVAHGRAFSAAPRMSSDPRPRPAFADDLSATLAEAFRLLSRGVADRRHGFHTPTLASIGLDGAPMARTVVLRGFDASTRTLRIHTDGRSAKCAEILAEPRVALHCYDTAAQVQLRIAATARLHAADPVAEAAWAGSRSFSRMCYAADPPPGTPIPAPLPAPTDPEAGRPNFVAVTLSMRALEWLWLDAAGHRRARFDFAAEGIDASWIAP